MPGLFTDRDIKLHLEIALREIRSALIYQSGIVKKTLATIIPELEEIGGLEAEEFEKLLNELDTRIDEALIEGLNDETLNENKRQVENDLAKHKSKMDTDGYQTTFELMLNRRLRKSSGIPRLSLFDL